MNKESNGIWWLPSKEKQKFPGTLIISSNGKVNLHLFGKLEEKSEIGKSIIVGGEIVTFPIINGTTIDGKEITLVNCELTEENMNVNGIINQTYSPSFTYVGKIFKNIDDLKFNSISISLSYLSSWFKDTGFLQHTEYKRDTISEYELTYSFPKEIEIPYHDYKLSIFRTFKKIGSFKKGLELKEDIHFSISLNDYFEIEHLFEKFIRPLQNLMTLSTNKPSLITELYVYSTDVDNNGSPLSLEVLFEKSFWEEDGLKDIIRSRMLLRAEDIEQGFEIFFKNWFRLSNELIDVYSFLFAPLYNKNMYLQNQYFTIIQAVEGFHRSLLDDKGNNIFKQTALTENEYNKKKELIKKCIPKEHRDWFYSKTQYNEPSLKDRIVDLIEYIQNNIGTKLFDSDLFAKKAADFRNMLAHPKSERTIPETEFESVVYIQETLIYILYLITFIELGFAKKFILRIVQEELSFFIDKVMILLNRT